MLNPSKKLFLTRKFISRKLGFISHILKNIGWTWTTGAIITILIFAVIALSFDIYIIITQATKNYKLLAQEQQKLDLVTQTNRKLDQDLSYYSSLEYRQRYAYDSLNLAKPGESLYIIDNSTRPDFQIKQEVVDPIAKDDPTGWWNLLFTQLWNSLR